MDVQGLTSVSGEDSVSRNSATENASQTTGNTNPEDNQCSLWYNMFPSHGTYWLITSPDNVRSAQPLDSSSYHAFLSSRPMLQFTQTPASPLLMAGIPQKQSLCDVSYKNPLSFFYPGLKLSSVVLLPEAEVPVCVLPSRSWV